MNNQINTGKIVIYQTDDGQALLEVNLVEETVWLNRAEMCQLFEKNKRTISEHVRNIFKEDELQESAVVRKFRTTARDGKDLYPSIEEKAAHLLYFIVKNHSFIDGNKRIAAAIFTWFLDRNNLLYRSDGTKRIADNALVALTLMIAMSDPKEKNVVTKIIVNLINKDN